MPCGPGPDIPAEHSKSEKALGSPETKNTEPDNLSNTINYQ